MGQVETLHFKSINQSKKGAIFTEKPATAAQVKAAKARWDNRTKNKPNGTLKLGSASIKAYTATPSFGKQYFVAGDFSKVKKQIPVGTAVDLVVTDKPVVNNTTKQVIKNLFWAYAPGK
tara:strand:+ start:978 stop:1334 length:357 start_codon:yes stop_codon:yes gene_type:complete